MKKISVYVKGDRNSPAYYRIYQYLDKLHEGECKCIYRTQMSKDVYRKWMPVSKQSIYIKIIVYIYIYFRVLWGLLCDWVNTPQIVVLHRCFIGHYMPYSYRFLIKRIVYRGAKLIWDYDDQIIANGEISPFVFDNFAKLAKHIIVTHQYLKSLLPLSSQDKVIVLPTTDGDMYKMYSSVDMNFKRINSLSKQVSLVWVATAVNIPFLEQIIPVLDEAAQVLHETDGRTVLLKVICNAPLSCRCENLIVENISWTHERAIQGMLDSHIGIMPLVDNEFTRGKGGFKLVQYISIGLPCIGSDVGFNHSVISPECGYLAKDKKDWMTAILKLSIPSQWELYSKCAYQHWWLHFSYERNLKVWKRIIKSNY